MLQLIDVFRACDENRQPLTFSVERHTETENLHAWVQDGAFRLASIGNRHVLNSPLFCSGTFEMDFHFTHIQVIVPSFTVFFRYDPAARTGAALRFTYDLEKSVRVCLLEADKTQLTELSCLELQLPEPLRDDRFDTLRLDFSGDAAEGSFAGVPFRIPCRGGRGRLALQRGNFIGELVLDRISFCSGEAFERQTVIPEVTAQVPCINGGDIPYTVSWRIERIEGELFFAARLDGGTRTRKVDRQDRPGQYSAEKDWMTRPYIGLTDGAQRRIFRLSEGELCFIDPNIIWECQKEFFGDTPLPLELTCPVPEALLCADTRILFGYENLLCTGYASQAGGCEFRYAPDGQLLDFGPPADGRDHYELFSQPDKLALSFVPEDCWHRQEVLEHLRCNHYFDVSETPEFTLELHTMTDPAYLHAQAAVLNVYESRVMGEYPVETQTDQWEFGYNRIRFHTRVPKTELGVWRIEFRIFFGDALYHRYVRVFEVYDRNSDENPALHVGLPFTFSMPNEQKRLMRNSFDFWNPARSCDVEHYMTCITETPDEAELRRSWRMIHSFKREWFAWLASRTCTRWHPEDHPEVVRHADYLYASWDEQTMDLSQSGQFPLRQDHFNYRNFMMRSRVRLKILEQFLAENPQFAQKLTWKPGMEFTCDCYCELMELCADPWIEYQNARGMEILREYNAQLREYNPATRRAIYGPVNSYVTPTHTSHVLRQYGFSDGEAMVRDCFTGFCVLEDYPYSSAYPTWRGAFMAMQFLLEAPGLVLYPEQYRGSRGGCIDGAVKFAHAPMGAYTVEPYQNSAHAFEFVFNTAHRRPDGFHYWDTYGFHRRDYQEAFMDQLVRDWRYVVENKPARPMKTMAYLAEYTASEDVFTVFRENDTSASSFMLNRSDAGHGLIHDCSREAGLPNGFALKYDALETLTADECDLLVLPDLEHTTQEQRAQLRRLYESGVNFVAVSRVDGLEDLFGVERADTEASVTTVVYEGEQEYVRAVPTTLLYRAAGAQAVMVSDRGEPLALRMERTLLLNAPVTSLGCADAPSMLHCSSPHIVGRLIHRLLRDELRRLCRPLAVGENHTAVTPFITESGKRVLLVMDYTPFDNRNAGVHRAAVRLQMPDVTGVRSDQPLMVGRKNGAVTELRFEIAPHGFLFIDLLCD